MDEALQNSRTYKLGSLWSIKSEDITISESVDLLCQWSENGFGFKSPEDHYEYTCTVETNRTLNKILRRFLIISYYDIISELNATKQRCSKSEDGGVAFVVAVICQSGKHDRDIVRERVMRWTKIGRRYRKFMQALCPGCIILFPEKISHHIWEQYVPIKGDDFVKAIQFLQNLGIINKCEEEGWNDLSDKVLQILRAPFRSPIPFQFQPDKQSQTGQAVNLLLAPITSDTDLRVQERSMLSHEQVEEIQDKDIDNTPPRTLDLRTLPSLAANGLIKTKWPDAVQVRYFGGRIQDMLLDFYLNPLCSGRTVLKHNAYFNDFPRTLNSNGRTINPLLGLSASYYKEYFPEGSVERKQMEYAECKYIAATAAEVRYAIMRGDVGPSTAVAAALLLHQATLNPLMHPCCWTKYLYPMQDPAGADVEANLAMASVAILAMTALPLNGKRAFQRFDYSWIRLGEAGQLTKVNSTLGLSRMMLYFIYSITEEAKHPHTRNAELLLRQIEESPHWVDQTEGDMPTLIALKTAETYRLATRVYCLVRLFGYGSPTVLETLRLMIRSYGPEHPIVKKVCALLIPRLYELPTEGPWYSSIHPAWCFWIACVCVQGVEDYVKLVNTLDRIAGENKSNVDDVCSLLRWIRDWQSKEWESPNMRSQESRWWERMTEYLDPKMKVVICLA